METKGSLPCTQEPAISAYPEPDQTTPLPSYILKIHFNIILPFTPRYSANRSTTEDWIKMLINVSIHTAVATVCYTFLSFLSVALPIFNLFNDAAISSENHEESQPGYSASFRDSQPEGSWLVLEADVRNCYCNAFNKLS